MAGKWLGPWASGGGGDYDSYFTTLRMPSGFPNRTDTSISFDNASRTLTLAPTGDTFDVWVAGVLHTFDEALTYQIADETGSWFFYVTPAGALTAIKLTSPDDVEDPIISNAPTAYVYWDADLNIGTIVADERHGAGRNPLMHYALHDTVGAQWSEGFTPSSIVIGDGSSNTHAQFQLASGEIFDEDMEYEIQDGSPQNISPILYAPVLYRDGSTWKRDAATAYPVKMGSTRPAYNSVVGTTWGQTEVDNGRYFCTHIIVTNDMTEPIMALQGTTQYTSVSAARAGCLTELTDMVLRGLPAAEYVFLFTFIFQTSNTYANAVKARIIEVDSEGNDYVDWRFSSEIGGGGGSGGGGVVGPGTSTDNAIPRWDGTGGATLLNSGVVISDDNDITGIRYILDDALVFKDAAGAKSILSLASADVAIYVDNLVSILDSTGAQPRMELGDYIRLHKPGFGALTNPYVLIGNDGWTYFSNIAITTPANNSLGFKFRGGLLSSETDLVTIDIDGNMTIAGNLTVSGTTITANTETVLVEDNIIVLNNGESGSSVTAVTAGLEIERGSGTNWQLLFDDSTDLLMAGFAGTLYPVVTGPASSTADAIPRFGNTTGSAVVNSGVTISGDNDVAGIRYLLDDALLIKDAAGTNTLADFTSALIKLSPAGTDRLSLAVASQYIGATGVTCLTVNTDGDVVSITGNSQTVLSATAGIPGIYASGTLTFKADTGGVGKIYNAGTQIAGSTAYGMKFGTDLASAPNNFAEVFDILVTATRWQGIRNYSNPSNEWIIAASDADTVVMSPTGTISLRPSGETTYEFFSTTTGIKIASAGQVINEFSTDTTLAGDSDSALPTEHAVKSYVDGKTWTSLSAGNSSIAIADTGSGVATITLDARADMLFSSLGGSRSSFIAGSTASHEVVSEHTIQVLGTTATGISIADFSDAATGPTIMFAKNRSGIVGSPGISTILSASDDLGAIKACAYFGATPAWGVVGQLLFETNTLQLDISPYSLDSAKLTISVQTGGTLQSFLVFAGGTGAIEASKPLRITTGGKLASSFYSGTTAPDGTTRLNWDGYLYATGLAVGTQLITTISTSTSLGTSDSTLSTQAAIKSYVDTAIAGVSGSGDIIEEGDSSVEVVDAGTGYINITADANLVARAYATGLQCYLGVGDRLWAKGASSGASALSQDMRGILLTAVAMNATSKYTAALMFGSTDTEFTTVNPKMMAGIVGEATESYAGDTQSGMKMSFFATANTQGTSPTPTVVATLGTTEAEFLVPLSITNTTKVAGCFYSGTTEPTDATRLNYSGNLYLNGLALGAGTYPVTEIVATLSAVDTALPTCGACKDYIDSFRGDSIYEGNSTLSVVDTGTGNVQFTVDSSYLLFLFSNGARSYFRIENHYRSKVGFYEVANASQNTPNQDSSGIFLYCNSMDTQGYITPGVFFGADDAQFTTVSDGKVLAGIVGANTEIYNADATGGMRVEIYASVQGVAAGGALTLSFIAAAEKAAGCWYPGTTDPTATTRRNYDGYLYVTSVYGGGGLDFADSYRIEQDIKPGYVYYEDGSGVAKLCTERCQRGVIGIASDMASFTAGTSIVKGGVAISVAGWVLARCARGEKFETGDKLTNDKSGRLTKMSSREFAEFPERLVATYLRAEKDRYISMGDRRFAVAGRHWVKVR